MCTASWMSSPWRRDEFVQPYKFMEDPKSETLWILSKDGRTMTCVVVGPPGHEELRVLLDSEIYLSEIHTVHEGTIGRANTLLHGFVAHGWTPING